MSSRTILIILVRNLYFLDKFLKNIQISNFIEISPVGGEWFDEDRRTDMMKLIVAFCNFVNMPKK
jgi:arabinogalactan endo-1,4-beta-galactosidase